MLPAPALSQNSNPTSPAPPMLPAPPLPPSEHKPLTEKNLTQLGEQHEITL